MNIQRGEKIEYVDMSKKDKIFAKGIYFDKPKEGSPDFVKGKISVKVDDFIAFAKEHEKKIRLYQS